MVRLLAFIELPQADAEAASTVWFALGMKGGARPDMQDGRMVSQPPYSQCIDVSRAQTRRHDHRSLFQTARATMATWQVAGTTNL